MKRASALVCKMILAVILGILVVLPLGCTSTRLGETAEEGRRRQQRVQRINQHELTADIEMFLLLDQPSRLTDKRIP